MSREKNRLVRLADLAAVIRPSDPSATVKIAFTDAGDDFAVTDLRTALAAYGDVPVASCEPGPGTMLFVLDRGRTDTKDYVANPRPIPFGVPSWRIGDDVWIFPPGAPYPTAGRITAASLATVRNAGTTVTVNIANGDGIRTYPDVPVRALFPDAASALLAARKQRS